MKLLITGGFGYLGGRLAQFLAPAGYEILLGTRRQSAPPFWLPQSKVVETRWDSSAALEHACTGVDAVVHLAGMNAQDCAANPVLAVEFNACATARLVHAAVRQRVKRFLYVSTAHVYGSPLSGVITEETCPVSLHPYATSHRAGEDVVRAASQRGEIEGIVARLSNTYGAPARKEVNCWTLLVNDLCRQALTTQRMALHTSGMQRRDFIALTDACRAIRQLLEIPAAKLDNGLFNLGGRWSPTILEMTNRIAERIFVATGRRPGISRKASQADKNQESLDYEISKLVKTGFALSGNDLVDQEIDGLIQFCLKHVAYLS